MLTQILERVLPFFAPRHTVSNFVYFSFQPSDIDNISDEELLRLRKKGSGFELSSTDFGTHNIRRVTEHTVMKAPQDVEEETYPSEALALQLVAQQTSIPVPPVRRLVKSKYMPHCHGTHSGATALCRLAHFIMVWPCSYRIHYALLYSPAPQNQAPALYRPGSAGWSR